MTTATLQLATELLRIPSPTPKDGGCMEVIAARLAPLGFVAEFMEWGEGDSGVGARVRNLWLKRKGSDANAKTLVFAGHTDVVPTGPLDQWISPPFEPTVRDGLLYARGAADMKTSIAAFTVAVQEALQAQPAPRHHIALLLTSDEEGPGIHGTAKVCEALHARGERMDWCIVGEPTSVKQTGDMIKNGRRGTLSGKLTVVGVQGHIAYPHLAKNPVHLVAPALAELTTTVWDKGNDYFQPTSWQVSNIHAGTGAANVIAGQCVLDFNWRFCTESTPEALQTKLLAVLHKHGLRAERDYRIAWTLGGLPFLTPKAQLVQVVSDAIFAQTGLTTELSTTGGTSDGRFIAQTCPEVLELGPTNASIHKINEYVPLADIEPLKNIYKQVIESLAF